MSGLIDEGADTYFPPKKILPLTFKGVYAMTLSEQIRKEIVGRKIKKVLLNRFHTGIGEPPYSYDPVIFLEDGTTISFSVAETIDGTTYGIDPIIS